MLVGDKFNALKYVCKQDQKAAILARGNETVSQLKYLSDKELGNLWDLSRSIDSNFQRQMFIYSIIYTVELMGQRKYEDALKNMTKIFKQYSNGDDIPQNVFVN